MPNRIEPSLISINAILMNFLYIPLLIFMNENAQQLIILVLFMLFDFIFEIGESYKLGIRFTPHRFQLELITKLVTLCLPFIMYFLSLGLGSTTDQMSNLLPYCLGALIISEAYSILGSCYTIITGEKIQDVDLLSFFIIKIRLFIETWLKSFKL